MEMKKSEITIEILNSVQTQELRHLVLWPHIQAQKECTIDIDDCANAFHLGAVIKGRVVSVASFFQTNTEKLNALVPDAHKHYQLRAMATHVDYRREGAGREIINFALNKLKKMNIDILWCNARKVALDFYLNQDFESIDQWYEVPPIGPHKLMYYRIKDY